MPTVRILSDHVANQIAAGEVVERPVAVVKELVENSLDAGATRVEIEFRQGGKNFLRVSDNGCGMSPDDALLSIERHATSKIQNASDLLNIRTFGFRGEALPSIASVSRFTLRTRPADRESGTEIFLNAGKLIHQRDCGMAPGTVVEVAQLFHCVPARRKFLKTDRTEAAHIIQLCRLLAVAHPRVAFRLLEDGRELFHSPQCPTLRDRIREIFGAASEEDSLELVAEENGLRVGGLVGQPGLGRSTRHEIFTFVNQRPVESRTLTYALLEGYHAYLPRGRYPYAFLFLEIEPAWVDVNVHPAKREVRFRDEGMIRRFVLQALLRLLEDWRVGRQREIAGRPVRAGTGESRLNADEESGSVSAGPGGSVFATSAVPVCDTLARERPELTPEQPAKPSTFPPDRGDARAGNSEGAVAKTSGNQSEVVRREAAYALDGTVGRAFLPVRSAPRWRFLGLAHGQFAYFETENGVVCLSWRAAEERIFFENIMTSLQREQTQRQGLLFPIALEFDPLTAEVVNEHLAFLAEIGFVVELFGRNFFRLTAIPHWFVPEQAESFVRDLADRLRERSLRPDQPDLAREHTARLAAAACAKVLPLPKENDFPGLLVRLFSCQNPLFDPRGRKIFEETPLSTLRKPFAEG